MKDRDLVRKILEGDPSAQELFVKLYRESLRLTCFHILGSQDAEVEDVLQETFAKAFQKIGDFEFRSSLKHWLERICVHLCYRRWRKRKRFVVLAQEELEGLFVAQAMSNEKDKNQDFEQARKLEMLERGKSGLGQPCRELIGLRDEQGKTYGDIAEILRVPMGTVMSRLARCRQALKELVQRALLEDKHE
jgi:RNA polymerase sigma-70 factor (ECF subfamily)